MNEKQTEILQSYQREFESLVGDIDVDQEGEHLIDNYQRVTSVILRLSEIRNEIALMEIWEQDWPALKKFRTLILDPTIERLERVAAFESRKITARQIEASLER